jgi:hypothetical protein
MPACTWRSICICPPRRGRTWQAFSGAELLTWLADQAPASSQTPPQAVAASLLGGRLITPTGPSATSALPHSSSSSSQAPGSEAGQQQPQLPAVNPGDWYSLASEAPPVPVGQPLNSRLWWAGPARPAAQVRTCHCPAAELCVSGPCLDNALPSRCLDGVASRAALSCRGFRGH